MLSFMKKLTISGMSCQHCVKAVTQALEGLGLKDVEVDLNTGSAAFAEADVDINALREAIDDSGFEVESVS
jgi:copper chaperone